MSPARERIRVVAGAGIGATVGVLACMLSGFQEALALGAIIGSAGVWMLDAAGRAMTDIWASRASR